MLRVQKKGYHRKAYVRRDGVRVKASYVPPTSFNIVDRGAVGRGQKLFEVKKGLLTGVGYHTAKSDEERHSALRRAVDKYGGAHVWRMLNAQVLFRKREADHSKGTFREDRDYVKTNLMSHQARLKMTAKPRRKWSKGMTHRQRQIAMPRGAI
jgi:hypothetical protein